MILGRCRLSVFIADRPIAATSSRQTVYLGRTVNAIARRAGLIVGLSFESAVPNLFHVTRSSAVESISSKGLLPAAAFTTESDNRDSWTCVGEAGAWLRWQRLQDHILLPRLSESISPAEWRAFINGMVFLFPSRSKADKLLLASIDSAVRQVVLRFKTEDLLQAGCDLRVCRWNNGYPDRSKPVRLRSYSDYEEVSAWRRGKPVQEVTISGGIPASVPFSVIE